MHLNGANFEEDKKIGDKRSREGGLNAYPLRGEGLLMRPRLAEFV